MIDLLSILIGLVLGGGFVALGYRLRGAVNRATGAEPAPQPQVVVNVPAEWKDAIPTLPATQVEGARAVLWYAVFDRAMQETSYVSTGVNAANSAVGAAFGYDTPES